MKIEKSFFVRDNVLEIARELLGKSLFVRKRGQLAGGIITEVEAYQGVTDRACHAFGGRRTQRNEMMYHEGGVAYVYLCYGIHHMLNLVTNAQDVPDAILVRAIRPTHGEELMLQRTRVSRISDDITSGPGKLCKALGLDLSDNGCGLNSETIWLEDRGLQVSETQVQQLPRIGVDYAGDDALLPYRFLFE